MRKYGTTWAVFFLLLVLVVFVFLLTGVSRHDEPLTYTQLQNLIHEDKSDQIQKVTFTNQESTIQVKLAGNERERNVIVPTEAKEKLIEDLNAAHVVLEIKDPDKTQFWFSMISSFFLPILLLLGF